MKLEKFTRILALIITTGFVVVAMLAIYLFIHFLVSMF